MRPRCWRLDFLRARGKHYGLRKLPNASLILRCVIGVSLIQLQRQKPKHTWLANSLLPDYQILLTIQPKATPTQTAAITTDSDFNLCTCTFRSHNPSTALSIFSFNASTSSSPKCSHQNRLHGLHIWVGSPSSSELEASLGCASKQHIAPRT